MADVRCPPSDIVFVYGTRDTIWPGVGMALLAQRGFIADVLFRAESFVKSRLGWSLLDALRLQSPLQEFMLEPTNTAIQLALTAAWHDRGIKPAAVLGRCVGEFAAVHACGAISFDDALALACRVSGLIREGRGRGRMLGLFLSENDAKDLSAACPAPYAVVSEGADNSTVIAFDAGDLATIEAFLAKHQIRYFLCKSGIAPHSWIMEGWKQEMLSPLRQYFSFSIPIYSGTCQGRVAPEVDWGTHFWRVVREPVFIRSAIRSALDEGFRCFVEVGGHPTLREFILGEAQAKGLHVAAFATMERSRPLQEVMERTEAALRAVPREVDYLRR